MEIAQPKNTQDALQSGVRNGLTGAPPNMRSPKAAARIQGSFSSTLSTTLNRPVSSAAVEGTNREDSETSEATGSEQAVSKILYEKFLQATEAAAKAAQLAHQANLYNEMYRRKEAAQHANNNRGNYFTPVSKPKTANSEAQSMVSGMSEDDEQSSGERSPQGATEDNSLEDSPATGTPGETGQDPSMTPESHEGQPGSTPNGAPLPDGNQPVEQPSEGATDGSTPDGKPAEDGENPDEKTPEGEPGSEDSENPEDQPENKKDESNEEGGEETNTPNDSTDEKQPESGDGNGSVSGTDPEAEQERANQLQQQRQAARQKEGEDADGNGDQAAEGEEKPSASDYILKNREILIALMFLKEISDFFDLIPYAGWIISYAIDAFSTAGIVYIYYSQSKVYLKNVVAANIGLILLTATLELFPYIGMLPLVSTLKLYLDYRAKAFQRVLKEGADVASKAKEQANEKVRARRANRLRSNATSSPPS